MQVFIIASLISIMLIASLEAIRKPKAEPHIDLVLRREQEKGGINVIRWVLGLIGTIVVLRLLFGA